MRNAARKRLALAEPRNAYRTLAGWALGILVEVGAVTECDDHGHRRELGDPDAWHRARARAWSDPFPGTSSQQALAEIDRVLQSIGDTCPDCR